MSKWSQSNYEGPIENGWYQGHGKFTFPNGIVYDGQFDKGEFHGEGTLIYPNGGKYVAKWERGKMIEGKYYFFDNLEYKNENWTYCTPQDRRFYTEITQGLRPDGKTLITNDINGPPEIPEGTYDVGDGYYDPLKEGIYNYDSSFNRDLESDEKEWIIEKCRYVPKSTTSGYTGKKDKIVQKMILLNNLGKIAEEEEENKDSK